MPSQIIPNENISILLVGDSGVEYTLTWKLSQSPRVSHIFCYPGNAGVESLPKVKNIQKHIDSYYPASLRYQALVRFAKEHVINLAVLGFREAVCDGAEELFREYGIPCFAPTEAAARLESNPIFAKDFMQRHGIPTPSFKVFSGFVRAVSHLMEARYPVIFRGAERFVPGHVITPESRADQILQLLQVRRRGAFEEEQGIVIEQRLEGQEISALAMSDGNRFYAFPAVKVLRGLQEVNVTPKLTGMATYMSTPSERLPLDIQNRIVRDILEPTFRALNKEGRPSKGCLSANIILTTNGPKLLGYRTVFPDPETQAIIPLIDKNTDLAEVLLACVNGTLDKLHVGLKKRSLCSVALSADQNRAFPAQGEQARDITDVQSYREMNPQDSDKDLVLDARISALENAWEEKWEGEEEEDDSANNASSSPGFVYYWFDGDYQEHTVFQAYDSTWQCHEYRTYRPFPAPMPEGERGYGWTTWGAVEWFEGVIKRKEGEEASPGLRRQDTPAERL
ncbi:uncharacterized protein BDR25DRAFT_345942 [Lindgomyces ingoldianus]|uniref:Uncharacterized protein n=1 Tax=Lindgomyces ingoldianus TaxID=673940 RepID=A0ACB6QFW3_9PLEO|nr:uncharacterized protein BDR25DRAFT_345942 [Lindgomyces ingoldianus]KAF2465765.1 hypothetical protein BDR25DRAFT_345942 [Lindgomyces ingoldianus]